MKRLYTWIENLNYRFWKRIVSSTFLEVKSLSAFRIFVGIFLLISYLPIFNWIADVPATFFYPPILSLANLLERFPGKIFFYLLDYLALISLVCLTIGIKARLSTLVYLFVCLVGLHFQYSFGKIDHKILPYIVLGCMAFSGWGRHLALFPDREIKLGNTQKSLSLLAFVICFAMFTAGFRKALVWIDFDMEFNGFFGWSQGGIFAERNFLLAPYVKDFPDIILEIIDYTAVIFELSPILFLLHSRRAWKFWLLLACFFHLGNTLLLNIPFAINSVVYLVFIDYSSFYNKLKYYIGQYYIKVLAGFVIIILFIVRALLIIEQDLEKLIFTGKEIQQINLYFAIIIWCLAITAILTSIYKSSQPTTDFKR